MTRQFDSAAHYDRLTEHYQANDRFGKPYTTAIRNVKRRAAEHAHAADAPAGARKIVGFLTISSTDLSGWRSQERG